MLPLRETEQNVKCVGNICIFFLKTAHQSTIISFFKRQLLTTKKTKWNARKKSNYTKLFGITMSSLQLEK
jgi:hypothetical protein